MVNWEEVIPVSRFVLCNTEFLFARCARTHPTRRFQRQLRSRLGLNTEDRAVKQTRDGLLVARAIRKGRETDTRVTGTAGRRALKTSNGESRSGNCLSEECGQGTLLSCGDTGAKLGGKQGTAIG